MRKVLFVIDSFSPSGRASQLRHLALTLRREGWPIGICSIHREPNPYLEEFTAAGIWTSQLDWRSPVDVRCLNPWDNFRIALGKEEPEVICPWGLNETATFALTVRRPSQLTVSAALPRWDRWQWPIRWLLKRVRRVIALGESEAERYRRLGVSADRLLVVPSGVPVADSLPAPATLPTLPDTAPVILCLGPMLRHKGHREAIWAFEILRMIHPDLRMVIVGNGADSSRIRQFVHDTKSDEFVHFTGPIADVSPWLSRAVAVWVPSLHESGRYAALEAMAAGRPVIASRLPGLAEIVVDGQTGYLVPPGDKPELSRKTRVLLDHPDLAVRMGAAGRRRVIERFSLAAHVSAMATVLRG